MTKRTNTHGTEKIEETITTTVLKFRWERAIRAHGFPPTTMCLALLIATYANAKTGLCWPAQSTLAKTMHVGTKSISRHAAVLEKAGWLTIVFRGTGQTSTTYQLAIPEGWEGAAAADESSQVKTDNDTLDGEGGGSPVGGPSDGGSQTEGGSPVTSVTRGPTSGVAARSPVGAKQEENNKNQSITQRSSRVNSVDIPPKGISEGDWARVRGVLIDVQSTLTPDARTQLGADWAGLTDKAGFCRGVLALLATKKRAAVSDALLDGGFDGATDYARVLYHRVAKLVAATEGAPLATKGPVADAIAEVLMALSAPRSVAPSMA